MKSAETDKRVGNSSLVIAYLESNWLQSFYGSKMNKVLYDNDITILSTSGYVNTKFKIIGRLLDIQKAISIEELGIVIKSFRKPFPWERRRVKI
ncbi:hypothetical protein GYA27_03160 [candidate division WWE3 bacterium]|uniref:Uncharacterized protein n=1 Tax=candidate division WWE3 bacterium TaxID=2053526 RepID=A0A7X9DKP5_UNCKA|nr:hypothetical protein [candidate division WWE3 bacterium]